MRVMTRYPPSTSLSMPPTAMALTTRSNLSSSPCIRSYLRLRPSRPATRSPAANLRSRLSPRLPRLAAAGEPFRRRCGAALTVRASSSQLATNSEKWEDTDAVLEAVDALGGRVTVGDVAARTGLKISAVESSLRALAADTLAALEVSEEGEIVYVFEDARRTLLAKSVKLKYVVPALNAVKVAGGYLLRVSFGTTLLASLAIVYTAIYLILNSRSSDSDNRSSNRGPNFYFSPFDMFWYWDPYYYERRQAQIAEGKKMNFLEAVFSFVFGDGDPNRNLDDERWLLVGDVIQQNDGVVTAEQLLPFVDAPASAIGGGPLAESYVTPVLQRFEGQPIVNGDGELLYRFPSFQTSASGLRGSEPYTNGRLTSRKAEPGTFLYEQKLEFSAAKTGQITLAALLGLANLAGVIILGSLLKDPQVIQAIAVQTSQLQNIQFLGLVTQILPLLQAYAVSFFAIPLLRYGNNLRRNASITGRNDQRAEAAQLLQTPTSDLKRKILSAKESAQKNVIEQDQIVYNTNKDMDEQEDWEAKEFDRKLREDPPDQGRPSRRPTKY